jgi:hypothetical protein
VKFFDLIIKAPQRRRNSGKIVNIGLCIHLTLQVRKSSVSLVNERRRAAGRTEGLCSSIYDHCGGQRILSTSN